MDWCVKPFDQANHPPVPAISVGSKRIAAPGDTVRLDARTSSDPDRNRLSFKWEWYAEAGTFITNKPFRINASDKPEAWFIAPEVTQPETIHLILSVTDDGQPSLTRYLRVIVTVMPRRP
jgi:hypothetical protein